MGISGLPPPYLREKARIELGETPESRGRCLPALKRRIESEDPDLKVPKHDAFLLKFLRVSKFDVDKAFERVRTYYSGRLRYDTDFKYAKMEYVGPVLRTGVSYVLPERLSSGCSVMYYYAERWDAARGPFDIDDIYRALIMIFEKMVEDVDNQISGLVFVLNYEGFSWKQFVQYTPNLISRSATFALRMIPARIKEVHVVNEDRYIKVIFRLLKPFLSSKLKKRIFFHGSNVKELQKYVNPANLPKEVGGTLEFDCVKYAKEFEAWEEKIWRKTYNYGYKN